MLKIKNTDTRAWTLKSFTKDKNGMASAKKIQLPPSKYNGHVLVKTGLTDVDMSKSEFEKMFVKNNPVVQGLFDSSLLVYVDTPAKKKVDFFKEVID
jgi:hypothetical protein